MCIQKRTHKSYAVHLKFPWKWRENNNNNDDEQIIYYVNNNKKLRIKFGKYLENHCVCVCKRWRGGITYTSYTFEFFLFLSWLLLETDFIYHVAIFLYHVCGVRCGAMRCKNKQIHVKHAFVRVYKFISINNKS